MANVAIFLGSDCLTTDLAAQRPFGHEHAWCNVARSAPQSTPGGPIAAAPSAPTANGDADADVKETTKKVKKQTAKKVEYDAGSVEEGGSRKKRKSAA
jgi:hypothetical protein